MSRVRQRDTAPELRLRSALWGRGLRYRVNVKSLPGSPDIVFSRQRLAVFVHGCFWHGHTCRHGMARPKANASYWAVKLDRNRVRDAAAVAALEALGWHVIVVWECEDANAAAEAIAATMRTEHIQKNGTAD